MQTLKLSLKLFREVIPKASLITLIEFAGDRIPSYRHCGDTLQKWLPSVPLVLHVHCCACREVESIAPVLESRLNLWLALTNKMQWKCPSGCSFLKVFSFLLEARYNISCPNVLRSPCCKEAQVAVKATCKNMRREREWAVWSYSSCSNHLCLHMWVKNILDVPAPADTTWSRKMVQWSPI